MFPLPCNLFLSEIYSHQNPALKMMFTVRIAKKMCISMTQGTYMNIYHIDIPKVFASSPMTYSHFLGMPQVFHGMIHRQVNWASCEATGRRILGFFSVSPCEKQTGIVGSKKNCLALGIEAKFGQQKIWRGMEGRVDATDNHVKEQIYSKKTPKQQGFNHKHTWYLL